MKSTIFRTKTLNPWYNLALEEYFFQQLQEEECKLYLWQNQNTVVIGKNQNPWKECRTKLLEEEGGKLARRLSGGGAVYHDLGNLNFTFIADRKYYNLEKQLQVILSATQKLGIDAKFSGRNDITVEEKKFSGNAFYQKPKKALHHGTILISADIANLGKYLQVSKEKIQSKGVDSVKARVVNLASYNPSLTIDIMAKELIASYQKLYNCNTEVMHELNNEATQEVKELEKKYASWEWRYGNAPKFDLELETRFAWGNIELAMKLEKSKITSINVYSDAIDEAFIEILPSHLIGSELKADKMIKRLSNIENLNKTREHMIADIIDWLSQKEF